MLSRDRTLTTPVPSSAGGADSSQKGAVTLRNVEKRFGDAAAVSGITLDVEPGEFVSLLGPSGCGKTTTLRMIAGLETPDSGEIRVDGRTVFSRERRENTAAHKRHLGFVFQSYALWPHMTVSENIAYPLRRQGIARAEVDRRVDRVLRTLQCSDLADRHPSELSGGQQQRIALGRAIVSPTNSVVLFDEPLSNLDARLRDELRVELRGLQRELGFTAIYVTHDRSEAMSMSDRLVVMSKGRVERIGSPIEVTLDPQKESVARLLGLYNYLPAEVVSRGSSGSVVMTALGPLPIAGARRPEPRSKVTVAVPITAIAVVPEDSAGQRSGASFPASIDEVALNGEHWDLTLGVTETTRLRARVPLDNAPTVGRSVTCIVTGAASILETEGAGAVR